MGHYGGSCVWLQHWDQWPYAEFNGRRQNATSDSKKLPIGVGSWALILYRMYVCGIVQMDRRAAWMQKGQNRNQSIKAWRAKSRNFALSNSTYPGVSYKLNPAVRMATWKERSWGSWPWKHKSNVISLTGGWGGGLRCSAWQMAWKSELLEISEDHVHIQAIRIGATVTEWPHTTQKEWGRTTGSCRCDVS